MHSSSGKLLAFYKCYLINHHDHQTDSVCLILKVVEKRKLRVAWGPDRSCSLGQGGERERTCHLRLCSVSQTWHPLTVEPSGARPSGLQDLRVTFVISEYFFFFFFFSNWLSELQFKPDPQLLSRMKKFLYFRYNQAHLSTVGTFHLCL